jgi:hypothetical protein
MSAYCELLKLAEGEALSRSLPTALRIAHSISDEEWAAWVRLELMGYLSENPAMKNETVVPDYRGVPGVWYDDEGRGLEVNDPNLAFINEIRLRQGVAELEGIAAGSGPLAMRPARFSDMIRNHLGAEVSVFRFQPGSVNQVLANIRTRLLDRVAVRREEISTIADNQVPQKGEVLLLRPSLYGVGVDLKALWRCVSGRQ